MNIKKITAVLAAAAMLTVAAPMTGVLPDPLSVKVSAEEYEVGDSFYAGISFESGEVTGEIDKYPTGLDYYCTVKPDGTIKIVLRFINPTDTFAVALYEKTLTIPSEINGYTVSEICDGFYKAGCKKVVIPDTVTTIGQSAFANSYFLEEVEFGSNSQLKLIDQWAFQDCRSLKSIIIPASVETIAYGAFMNTESDLSFRVLFYGLHEDGEYNFTDTYSLTTVNFAEGSKLKLIDQWAFQAQMALKSITLPDSLEKIGYGAFSRCTALTKINIPKNVDEIGAYAFQTKGWNHEIGNISEITVDESNPYFKSIDGVVYTKNGKIIVAYPVAKSGKYDIPADVNKIAEGAFGNCQKLTAVSIPEGVTYIPENAFSYCTALAEVKLPSTLKTIDKWGFEACAFTSIDIPENVTAIDAHAFDSTPLKTINGVEGSYAETFAKENGYSFNGSLSPSDTSTFTDDSEDKAADIEVIANSDAIPKEAHFSVRLDDENTNEEQIAYNCYFTYNGAEYEPTEKVIVRIPIPVSMRDIADTLKVYHLQDGEYVSMDVRVEAGYLVFETDHFSVYVVAEKQEEDDNSDTTTEEPTAPDTTTEAPTTPDDTTAAPSTPDDTTTAPSTPADTTTTPADSDKEDNPNTGVGSVAVVTGIAVAAAGAVMVLGRKRK